MERRRTKFGCPWTLATVALAVIATSLFLSTCESHMAGLFIATREGLVAGEFWRLATGPFVHGTVEHLFRDTVALLVLGFFAERRLGSLFLPIVGAGIVLPTVAVFIVPPGLDSYFGLSGLVHALLVAVILFELRQARGRWRLGLAAIGVIYVANLTFEMAMGKLLFPHAFGAGFHLAPVAPLAGALIGTAVIARVGFRQRASHSMMTGDPSTSKPA